MIAQVSIFFVYPKENLGFLDQLLSKNCLRFPELPLKPTKYQQFALREATRRAA